MSNTSHNINNIAIVGSGIAGLTAAYLLHKRYKITVFEANDYIGGHTNTVDVTTASGRYAVDTGFIVFNQRTYPNFIKLLDKLNVAKQKSNMSFSFSSADLGLEYSGDSINSLFAQRKNSINPRFYRLLIDIWRFNRHANRFLQHPDYTITLAEFSQHGCYHRWFNQTYLYPLASAIWSTPAVQVADMPAYFVLQFYANHGLLTLCDRPQWYVIKHGSAQYVKRLIAPFADRIYTNTPVTRIERHQNTVKIMTDQEEQSFDAVVMACHSDQVLAMLAEPSEAENRILSAMQYLPNRAVLHTDKRYMPQRHRAWASWNYLHRNNTTLTYYMNKLQSIDAPESFLVSINPHDIAPQHIIKTIDYAHPLYNRASMQAQQQHHHINNQQRTFYVGAYWGNGFHEDGVNSSLQALAPLGVAL